jgi:hypothetical protein
VKLLKLIKPILFIYRIPNRFITNSSISTAADQQNRIEADLEGKIGLGGASRSAFVIVK